MTQNKKYKELIQAYSIESYKNLLRSEQGQLEYPFIVPGSSSYHNSLWDWDSWLTDIAIRQIMEDQKNSDPQFFQCEKGCVLNFLNCEAEDGRVPIMVSHDTMIPVLEENIRTNIHKPCLAQHIAFIAQQENGELEWIKPVIDKLVKFIDYYQKNCFDASTGLYFWFDDVAIGVDNDPCTFFRPDESSASIYLNCLMYKELLAMDYICNILGYQEQSYKEAAERLKKVVNELMWDERNGFYYSVDINLKPINPNSRYHNGCPRNWSSVIQKIDVWSGFLAMWSGIVSKERAERMVSENLENEKVFRSAFGIRTLGKNEQMYQIVKSGNPSCWLGPVWGIANYLCFRGLVKYGFVEQAEWLAKATIELFGEDIEENGEMHEYYDPDSGVGVNNSGFQSWNLLVNNMIAWIEGRKCIEEF